MKEILTLLAIVTVLLVHNAHGAPKMGANFEKRCYEIGGRYIEREKGHESYCDFSFLDDNLTLED